MKSLWLICDYLCFYLTLIPTNYQKNIKKIIFKIWANLWANLELGTLNYLRSVGVWEFRSVDNTLPLECPA